MKDIDMDDTEWTPIGTKAHPFTGKFDGDNKTISNLKCTNASAEYVGLVGYAIGATIHDVTVKESSLNGNQYIGAVCGYIKDGTITNCHAAVNTVIGETRRDDFPQYCGGIVGYIVRHTADSTSAVTDCTNSGTVSGSYYIGGIAGFANDATVQRCFNTGKVTGSKSTIGGIVGKMDRATVQDCGNTGAVIRTVETWYYGGIVGNAIQQSVIENCYNANSTIEYPIGGVGADATFSNCYYLDRSGINYTGTTAKTQAQFASGEVAYLLQKPRDDAATADQPAEQVWGQTLTGANKQDYPVLRGLKVYQGTPCQGRYSNTEDEELNHNYVDGKCTYCGQPEIAYTVTIPASVELGNTATIAAAGVTLPNDKQLNVKVADGSEFKVALNGDTCEYTVTNKGDTVNNPNGTSVTPGTTVLTAENGESEKTVELQFNKPKTTTYSGTYTGTVSFTVSVDDKS